SVGTFGTNFPRLIVNQFKWLDRLLDSQDLVRKLMQMVSVSPVPIQHDIITSLPEILEDSQQSEHNYVSGKCCLPADGVLLSPQVRQSAMTIVPSVKLEDLPVVVKFILQNVKAADAVEVQYLFHNEVCIFHTSVWFNSVSSFLMICSSSLSQVTTSQNCVKLLFDVIKLAVRFQKDVSEAWIKVKYMLQSLFPYLFGSVSQGTCPLLHLSCDFLELSFPQHWIYFFPSILALAQTFLHSAHPAVVSFGSCMYKQAFAAFDSYCQQEVVAALVTHVCSGTETELDISLDVLTDLVVQHTSLLMRYATFVKTILDSTQKLNPCQIRKLFYILSTLAFSQKQEGSYIQDDMHMVIRKWLSSTVSNHKQMGIIGAVSMIGSVALKRPTPFLFSPRAVSPLCLSPCFRLLRLYTAEQNSGSLEEIDALLGCPLYLTDLEVEGKLDSLSKQEREFLCSLLFYALNWFREIVNAFCQQEDAEMKGKVLIRLQNITELQNVLGKCLAATPGYVPPPATFDSEAPEAVPSINAAGPARKRSGKENLQCLSKQMSWGLADRLHLHVPKTAADREAGNPLAQLQSYRPYFRELDLEVFTVLHCGLLTKSVLDTEMHTEAREVVQLGPAELCFLLDDLCWKLEHVLPSGSTRRVPFAKERGNKDVGFSHLCQRSPKEVAMCVVDLLKPLCKHMENMHNYFQGAEDEPGLNIQEHQLMSSCYQLLLLTFHITLSAHFLPLPFPVIPSESFQYLLNFQQSVPSFHCAHILTQLLIAIAEKPMSGWKKEKMASLAKQFLCQSWVKPSGDQEKGSQFNSALHTLLCVYLEHTDNILKAIEEISSVGVPELMNSAKDGCSSTYPTLTRQTFPVFFRVMMAQLESSVKSIPAGKPSDSSEVQLEKLLRWNIAVRNFHILINLVKVRFWLFFCLCLHILSKYGRLFVEAFLKLAMPLLDHSFKKHTDDVQSLLKTLQMSTRQLHHMCGHSKIHQDIGLTNHVPLLKKSLEQFVYRVKAMLAFNHCQEAFWVGILKNRDLQGEEILTQASEERGSDEDSENSAEGPAEEVLKGLRLSQAGAGGVQRRG
uniref:FA complementation group D2 n=1 Tax=Taeniopygia guttata TaxID=59729 RepID=H0Z8P4_TAEGU